MSVSRFRPIHAALFASVLLTTLAAGCARSPFASPTSFGQTQQPNFGNPWTTPPAPGAAPSLPPPSGQVAPGYGLPPSNAAPGGFPAVPSLPPPTGTNPGPGYGAPNGYGTGSPGFSAGYGDGGFDSPPLGSASGQLSLTNPGTMQQQQQRATQFDPYADNNAAPEIVGGRPRDFQKPLPETVRARGFRDTRWPF